MIFLYLCCCGIFFYFLLSDKKSFLKYGLLNKKGYLELKQTILTYGYDYNIKTHVLSTVSFLAVLGFLCYEFEVRFETFFIIALVSMFLLPHIMIWILFHSYQEKVFNGFTMFLQTFIAVFKINPKTYPSLLECEKVCENETYDLIQNMKETLQKEGHIEPCMQVLLNYQPHFIVHNLVTLVTTIENHGGLYNEGLDLIQDDIDDWIEDIYNYKKIQTSTKNKMMGLCLLSIGIAFISKNMLADISFNTNSELYQLAMFIFLTCELLTLFLAHKIFSKPWFEKEEKL